MVVLEFLQENSSALIKFLPKSLTLTQLDRDGNNLFLFPNSDTSDALFLFLRVVISFYRLLAHWAFVIVPESIALAWFENDLIAIKLLLDANDTGIILSLSL